MGVEARGSTLGLKHVAPFWVEARGSVGVAATAPVKHTVILIADPLGRWVTPKSLNVYKQIKISKSCSDVPGRIGGWLHNLTMKAWCNLQIPSTLADVFY